MRSSRYDLRVFAGLALVAGALTLAVQCSEYFLRRVADAETAGQKPTVVAEFGAGVPVSQSFSVPRDGLHSVTVAIVSDQPAIVGFQFSLIRKGVIADWPDEPITKRHVQLSVPGGVTKRTIDFPPVSRSKDRVFVATFTLSDVMRRGSTASDPQVALSAWADDAYRGGALKVGTEDRWGDLNFSAETDPPRRFARFRDSLDHLLSRSVGFGNTALVGLGGLYLGLLIIVGYTGVVSGNSPAAWSASTTERPSSIAHGRALAQIRAAAAVFLAVGIPVVLIGILGFREHVTTNLLEQLDQARFESPSGMHSGFSRIEEVINGLSPPALFAHPPSRITWTVAIPAQRPVFKTFVALRPYVWEHRSDGVQFDVIVTGAGGREAKVSRFVNPRSFNDRAWLPLDLDLGPFAGQSVQLSLITMPGPRGDVAWDWALWGGPRIVSVRWPDTYRRDNRTLNRDRSGD